jgi:D-alanyl-D-alanine carboxypeptidase
MKEYTYNGIRQHNRNRLLWADPTVDGLKTGHSSAAGYCLIATAKRGPRRLISVVLGTASEDARARDSLNLLNWGFTASSGQALRQGPGDFAAQGFQGRAEPGRRRLAEDFVSPCRAAWPTRSPPNWSASSR